MFRATDLSRDVEISGREFHVGRQDTIFLIKLTSFEIFLRKHDPSTFTLIESYWKNLSNRVLRTKIHQLYRFNLSLSQKKRLSSLFRTLVLGRDTDQFSFLLERTNSPSRGGKKKISSMLIIELLTTTILEVHWKRAQPSDLPLLPKKQGGWTQVTLSESEYS